MLDVSRRSQEASELADAAALGADDEQRRQLLVAYSAEAGEDDPAAVG
jgi:hypothetical protein